MTIAINNQIEWNNPYVTDGLIAMWDGEWNDENGRHNTDATIWKDISGNKNDLILDDNVVILDKALTSNSPKRFAYRDSIITPVFAEICVNASNMTSVHENHTFLSTGDRSQSSCFIFIYGKGKRILGSASTSWFPAMPYVQEKTIGTISIEYSPDILNKVNALYWNSVKQTSTYSVNLGGASSNQINVGGNNTITDYSSEGILFHSIRLYNRVLSQSEILKNYYIDKKRFDI